MQQYEGIMAADKLLYGRNARPIQPLNGRTINYCNFPAGSTTAHRTYPAPTCPAAKTASLRAVLPIKQHTSSKSSLRLGPRTVTHP